uniref:Putative secreted protein n=1 Tax=Anopheles marajoara TaxID=58244 RepID=A0A2M4CDB5_9DIPT
MSIKFPVIAFSTRVVLMFPCIRASLFITNPRERHQDDQDKHRFLWQRKKSGAAFECVQQWWSVGNRFQTNSPK